MDTTYSGTKKLIFEKAVELFSRDSFERVSLNDVAEQVGIRQSSIYNHFATKQELLDAIYDFFIHRYYEQRLTVAQIEPIIREGSISNIIHSLIFTFAEKNDKLLQQILVIVHQRKYFDPRARHIAKEVIIDGNIRYGKEVFDRAVEMGRLAPFNTQHLSLMINYTRQCTYNRWILNPTPEFYRELLEDENQLYEYFIITLVDLRQK